MSNPSAVHVPPICLVPSIVRAAVHKNPALKLAMPLAALLLTAPFVANAQEQSKPVLHTSILHKSSVPPGSSLTPRQLPVRMDAQPNNGPVNTGSGIVYTCDPNVAAATCTYLNNTVAAYYNDTFTNANADIYVQYGSTGLGQSEYYFNFVTYTQYATAYSSIASKSAIQQSAQTALTNYDETPYGGDSVWVQGALTLALGIGADTGGGPFGIQTNGNSCTLPSTGCYNGLITVTNDTGTPLYYDNLGGTEPADAYDFYAVVMHETDEVLGTSSCVGTNSAMNNTVIDNCDPDTGDTGGPSVVDLFRYNSQASLVLDSSLSTTAGAYFSYDGGTTDGAMGVGNAPKYYNTLANGDDYADYVSSSPDCGTNQAIQDAEGCPGEDAGLTILNDGGSEVNILTAVGYGVPSAVTPPSLTSPTSSPLVGSTKFTWSPGSGSTNFALWIGTTSGTYNIYTSGHVANTVTSETVNIPANGATLFVRLWYEVGGNWLYKSYTFTEAQPPALTSPTSSPIAGITTFTWSPGTGSSMFALWIGTSPGTYNVYTTGHVANTVTSASVNIAAAGATLYVSLWYEMNGAWADKQYTFTESQSPSLTAPTSSTISGSTLFTWSAGTGSSMFALWIGTTQGSSNIYTSGHVANTVTSETVNIPANGATIYVRLWYEVGTTWDYKDYVYKEGM